MTVMIGFHLTKYIKENGPFSLCQNTYSIAKAFNLIIKITKYATLVFLSKISCRHPSQQIVEATVLKKNVKLMAQIQV